jgi:hypothetical protein
MSSRRFLTGLFVILSIATFALGLINVMKLRLQADDVGGRIVRIERSIRDSQKELDALKRQRDLSQDTLQLIQRVGEDLKPPAPEQVTWLRLAPGITAVVPRKNTLSPRMTALDIAFRPLAEQEGSRTR